MHLFILLVALSITGIEIAFARRSYQQWQCSLPSQENINSLVAQNKEAFHMLDNTSWLTKKRKYVSCFQKGLTVVPQGMASDVEILNLAQNSIKRIRKNDFAFYSSLVAVSLLNNCIEIDFHHAVIPRCTSDFSIEAGAFLHLQNLTYLALSGSLMQKLPKLPKSVLVLFASFSSLQPIKEEEVDNLNALEIISLSTNCITGDLKHLCRRNFTIANPVFAAPNLKYLDLSFNNFHQIPSYLFQQSLLGIKLQGNPFHYVSSQTFRNATKITHLNLAWTCQYVDHMQSLDIEKGALDALLELKVLDLSGNMITSLPEEFLVKNLKLTALNLEFNCLKKVEMNPDVLPRLPLLEELCLAGNNFCNHTLYPDQPLMPRFEAGEAYSRFQNLTTLVLGMNDEIPNTVFTHTFSYLYFAFSTKYDEVNSKSFDVLKNLTYLRRLTFIGCGIRILNTSAFSGLNLTYLNLASNQIGEPAAINKINLTYFTHKKLNTAVQYLSQNAAGDIKLSRQDHFDLDWNAAKTVVDISKNGISDLKQYPLLHFSFATNLDLSENHINYIDSTTFQELQKLQVLNLAFNPIRCIHPEALSHLVSLSSLKLNISVFQEDITLDFLAKAQQDLTLQYGDKGKSVYRLLQFYRNNSTYFPNVISIDVSGIPIPPFFVSTNQIIFQALPNLKTLIMNRAHLTYQIQSNFFVGLPCLQRLSMSESWLEEFPTEALWNMTSLMYLDLSHNKLEVLKRSSLPTFPKLKTLLLSYNFIFEIEPGALQFLQKSGVIKIDLSFNRIWRIGPAIINRAVLKKLKSLDLRGNYVNCVCALDNTFGWLIDSGIVNHTKLPGFVPVCSSVLINYYGGCIACANSHSQSANPTSLFTYAVTNGCEEHFLSILAVSFTLFYVLFLSLALVTTNMYLKRKLTNHLLRNVRTQYASDNTKISPSIYAYNGFIVYHRSNQTVGDWVEKELVPRLENGNPSFKICVAGKEDWCGTTQVHQLLLRMRASRKTIIILSEKFHSTPQCQYILSVVEEWIYSKKNYKSIIITFGNHRPVLTKKSLRKGNGLIEYSVMHYSPLNSDPLFWTFLKNALII